MKEVIVCYGIPASSKDTWALEQLKLYPNKYKRVTKDLLRELLDDNVYSKENEKFMLLIRDKIIEKALRDGKSVIVSDTNFPFGGIHYQRICDIAKLVGDVIVKEKFFDVDVDECKRRNSLRSRKVPEDVIDKMYNKYVRGKVEHYQFREVYFPKIEKVRYDPNIQDCVYLDVDGTISEMSNRSPYDWKNVYQDSCNENVVQITRIIRKYNETAYRKIKVFIFTGRDGICLEMTEKWLDDCDVYYNEIFIRPKGNTEKDSIIKERIYREHIEGKYNLLFGVDDRNQVVDNFRSLGLTILQCNNGDF
jgi:predicted kinase